MILYHRSLGRKGSGYRVWNTGWSWPDTVGHLDASIEGGLEMNGCSNWRACAGAGGLGHPDRSLCVGSVKVLDCLGVDFAVWPRMCWCRGLKSRPRIHRRPFSARPGPLPHIFWNPFFHHCSRCSTSVPWMNPAWDGMNDGRQGPGVLCCPGCYASLKSCIALDFCRAVRHHQQLSEASKEERPRRHWHRRVGEGQVSWFWWLPSLLCMMATMNHLAQLWWRYLEWWNVSSVGHCCGIGVYCFLPRFGAEFLARSPISLAFFALPCGVWWFCCAVHRKPYVVGYWR